MRKFRIWDNKLKKFVTMNENPYLYAQLFVMLDGQVGEYTSYNDGSWFEPAKEKDRFVIQQFTGLFDNKNNEIFEGDILKVGTCSSWMNNNKNYHHMEVKYQIRKSGESDLAGYIYIPDDREVVGNIFENKELLS
jgi:uncharacterized phage protein (TIGR01671 family)